MKTKMKMTIRDKAFYEYGLALGRLRETIFRIRRNDLCEFGKPYHRLMKDQQKFLVKAFNLAGRIREVRQKRAECRSWTTESYERICENCAYQDCEEPDIPPCNKCYRNPFAISCEMNEDCWAPRKEGEAADAVGGNPGGNPHNSLMSGTHRRA